MDIIAEGSRPRRSRYRGFWRVLPPDRYHIDIDHNIDIDHRSDTDDPLGLLDRNRIAQAIFIYTSNFGRAYVSWRKTTSVG